jgi:hypothetical protein
MFYPTLQVRGSLVVCIKVPRRGIAREASARAGGVGGFEANIPVKLTFQEELKSVLPPYAGKKIVFKGYGVIHSFIY